MPKKAYTTNLMVLVITSLNASAKKKFSASKQMQVVVQCNFLVQVQPCYQVVKALEAGVGRVYD